MRVIYSPNKEWFWQLLKGKIEFYPENKLSTVDQMNYLVPNDIDILVTNSIFIVGNYDKSLVSVFKPEANEFIPVDFQTKGADYGILLKALNGVRSTISPIAVKEVREALKIGDQAAIDYLDKIGDSGEKAYLLRKLLRG